MKSSKVMFLIGVGALSVMGCKKPEDEAARVSITYSAPFLAVAEDSTGTCESKLKVAEELYKLEEPKFGETKAIVEKWKSDEKFKAKLKSEVEKVQTSGIAKSYPKACPKEAEKLAKIVSDTASAIGVADLVPAWSGKPG
ncbi:MAG: hypothetical protein U0271_04860 [Polyangiaceae bacterium]